MFHSGVPSRFRALPGQGRTQLDHHWFCRFPSCSNLWLVDRTEFPLKKLAAVEDPTISTTLGFSNGSTFFERMMAAVRASTELSLSTAWHLETCSLMTTMTTHPEKQARHNTVWCSILSRVAISSTQFVSSTCHPRFAETPFIPVPHIC